jgi:hypothetical protein
MTSWQRGHSISAFATCPQLNLGSVDDNKPVTLIVDASGLTVSNKGDYIEEKWIRKKKEFIKLHIAVDERSEKIVSFRITKGNVHDTKQFSPLIKESAKKHLLANPPSESLV